MDQDRILSPEEAEEARKLLNSLDVAAQTLTYEEFKIFIKEWLRLTEKFS